MPRSKADQVLMSLREPRWRSVNRIGPHNEGHLRAYLDCGHYVFVTKYWFAFNKVNREFPPINCPKCP